MVNPKPELYLVDGSSYLYRAFHAMPLFTNSANEPTGAVYGMANMLRGLLSECNPEYLAVILDAKGKTFRDDMYPEYKANRAPMPDELRAQESRVREVVRAMGIPLLEISGVEADDVIGTLCVRGAAEGFEVIICTSDKDMAQLVNQSVTIVNTMDAKHRQLDPDGVEDKFGVRPEQMVDYLALIGDSVDNVPGVPKVGPKTASKWLKAHGSLDAIMAKADEVKGKVGENLRASLDQLPLSKALVTIKVDVPMDFELEALRRQAEEVDKLRALYSKLEFRSWLSELTPHGSQSYSGRSSGRSSGDSSGGGSAETENETVETHYEVVLDDESLEQWVRKLSEAEAFAFDTETTDLDYMRAELVGVSFCAEPGKAAYVPFAHDYLGAPAQLAKSDVLGRLAPLLEDDTKVKVGQNLKYDLSVLAREGIELRGGRYDTMLESYLLDSTATRHDMDSLALKYLSYRTTTFQEIAGKGTKQCTFNQIDLEEAGPYAAEDADITLRLHRKLWPKLELVPQLESLFQDVEMPLVPVLSKIERTGVLVDAAMLRDQGADLQKRIDDLEAKAHETAGHPFNLGSPKQIQAVLFDELGLPVREKTPKGQPSTAESALQELAMDYELPRLILDHRAFSKLKSTYTNALPACINPVTGRVHTNYQQAIASTGRLASSDPNLQNIPIRTEEGRRIRRAFIAPVGTQLVAADYSQIELRIMAHLSGDAGLKDAFDQGRDIHRATAAEVFGCAIDAVSEEQRRSAKAINFGLIYGMSAFGLGRQLGISRPQAQRYVDLYFSRYPGVKEFMDETRHSARDKGYVETVFGRRLYLPEIRSRNYQRRMYAERTAINAPMQGTAADIIKRAMINLDRWLADNDVDARMIMQVHDELVFEISTSQVETLLPVIVSHMQDAAKLSVPLVVDAGAGDNWDEAH